MATITVVNENGQTVEQEVVNRGVALIKDAEDVDDDGAYNDLNGDERNIIEPAAAQRVEFDHEGAMSQVMTVCGETENRREGDEKPKITIEGIIGERNLEAMKTLHKGQRIVLVSDVDQGKVIVRRVTIEQNTDIVSIESEGREPQLAFGFNLQLKYPE